MDGGKAVELAKQQYGVLGLEQVRQLGFTPRQIERRVQSGTWMRVLPRVLRMAWAEDGFHARALAAWLWAGNEALVSHEAAGHLWGLAGCEDPSIVISLPYHLQPIVPWLRLHRVKSLPRAVRRLRAEIPVTSPARTLLDLAARDGLDIEAALVGALRRRLVTIRELRYVLSLVPPRGKPGVSRLRRLLQRGHWVEGELERRAFALFRRHGLRRPVCQFAIAGIGTIDFAWPQSRVLVECDGFETHSGKEAWGRDLARHNALVMAGWKPLRMTWEDATREAEVFVDRLRRLLR